MQNNAQESWEESFIEAGADLEHDRWAKWQKYLHSLCTVELKDGTFEETGRLIIEADRVNHWNRQIETPYSQLSEKEKEYDRVEVRKYLPLIHSLLSKQAEEIIGAVEGLKTYTGGSSVNEKDNRINKADALLAIKQVINK